MISYQTQLNIARSFLAAISTRDWNAMRALLTEDAHWTLPSDNTILGTANGANAVVERAKLPAMGLTLSYSTFLSAKTTWLCLCTILLSRAI